MNEAINTPHEVVPRPRPPSPGLAGAASLQVHPFSGFGTGIQMAQLITLRLRERRETVYVGKFGVK